ncbi:MAG: response regulator transcription factor [Planctomycetota bacterium]|jgi:DNA-binding response OmpR family regulator
MKAGQSILVVEDEPKIREGLRDFLEFQEFTVITVDDGLKAERIVEEKRFDLILLDLMLPNISGEQLCQKWRQQGRTMPIIMLTAKGQETEKIAGLDMGADDYVTKPFSLEELLSRIRAVLRRTDPSRSVGQQFSFGPFSVDARSLKITCNSTDTGVTQRQADILQLFAANPGRVISREQLYEKVWHESMDGIETRTVDMHIVRLRELLKKAGATKELIETIRGAGYKYSE